MTSVSHEKNMGTGRSTAPTQIPSTPGWRKVDRIRISTSQNILKISILLLLLFLSGEVIITQISISLSNKFINLKNVALKISMGLKVDLLNMLSTGRK